MCISLFIYALNQVEQTFYVQQTNKQRKKGPCQRKNIYVYLTEYPREEKFFFSHSMRMNTRQKKKKNKFFRRSESFAAHHQQILCFQR